jgi:DNA-binding response OmpR family regulator
MTRALIVDDDAAMRALVCDFLEKHGLGVAEEAGGEGVLGRIGAERFDVVVLDKEMPDLNGLEVLSRLQERHPDVPVILVTAFGGAEVAAEAVSRGARRYLEKPFRLAHLLAAIRALTAPFGA